MNLLIITDAYAPNRTSAAVLLKDLASEFIQNGHRVCVVVPRAEQRSAVKLDEEGGAIIFSVKAFRTKDISYVQRVLAEWINPYLMGIRLFGSEQFKRQKIDGVIWYSPSIFWGPLVKKCQTYFVCKSYLILRDLFPNWALDLGLLKKGFVYRFFKYIEYQQYRQATYIGLQSANNLEYFQRHYSMFSKKAQVLWNWIAPSKQSKCSIQIHDTILRDLKVAVYAGNVGVAQGKSTLFSMAKALHQKGMGIVFVGRGSEMKFMQEDMKQEGLKNILFFDEIPSDEIESLYRQCAVGLLALDPRHTTHNIPGKFLSYMQACIPVFAVINPGNDLEILIPQYQVGVVCASDYPDAIDKGAQILAAKMISDSSEQTKENCQKLVRDYFLPEVASKKILQLLMEH